MHATLVDAGLYRYSRRQFDWLLNGMGASMPFLLGLYTDRCLQFVRRLAFHMSVLLLVLRWTPPDSIAAAIALVVTL